MISVAVLGDLNWDLVLKVARLPQRGGEVLSGKATLRLGGSATNTARWLAWLGWEVRLFSAVGEDSLAQLAQRELEKEGIATKFLQRHPASTGISCAIVDARGERTLLTARGANAFLSGPLPQGWLEGAGWLHISGYALLEPASRAAVAEALSQARTSGIPVSLDPGMVAVHGHQEFLREISPVDVFLPNREEAQALGGLSELRKFGRHVFLKLGAEGCWVGEGSETLRIPGILVDVDDPVGAGDAFNAGVIAARILGGSVVAQASLGNVLGALATAALPPTPASLARLIRTLPGETRTELARLLGL